MPLKQSSSKKAFESNLKQELKVGKPKDRSLAIAFNVQRKNKKAKGGLIRGGASRPTADSGEHTNAMYAEGGEVRAGGTPPTADQGQEHACTYMCNGNKHYDSEGNFVRAGSTRPSADLDEASNSPTPRNNASGSIQRAASDGRPSADHKNQDSAPKRTPSPGDSIVRAGSTRPTADNDEMGKTQMLAHGGDVEDETGDHHIGTMAEAIAKRVAKHLMAEGGRVPDRDNNATEQDNFEDDLSFDALGKKVYDDEQLDDQPSDSNEESPEHEDEDIEDKSMISKIRKRARK